MRWNSAGFLHSRFVVILAVGSVLVLNHRSPVDAAPKLLPFQGHLTNAEGEVVDGEAKIVQFKIYDAPVSGNAIWAGEVHKLSVNQGLVNTLLGTKTAFPDRYGPGEGTVMFSQPLYLEITVDAQEPGTDGHGEINAADPPLLPRQVILPAVHAKTADQATNADHAQVADRSTVTDQLIGDLVRVSASKGIKLGLEGNGGGQLWLVNNPNDNKIFIEAFSRDRTTHASELLLTGRNGNSVPMLSFHADTTFVSGNVGLGTRSPNAKLEVFGGGNILLKDDASDPGDLVFATGDGTELGRVYASPSGEHKLFLSAGPNVNPELTVSDDGNVGIGTTSPGVTLHVRGRNNDVVLLDSPWDTSWLWLKNSGVSNGFSSVGVGSHANDLMIRTGNRETMRVDTNGNVGINGDWLRVEAGGRVAALGTDGFRTHEIQLGSFGGAVTEVRLWNHARGEHMGIAAKEFRKPSDGRLKENIKTLENALETIGRLRGVSFEWKEGHANQPTKSNARQLGFIAQEVKDVLPEAVSARHGDYYEMEYSTVIPILVEAVKELRAQNERQSKEIEVACL